MSKIKKFNEVHGDTGLLGLSHGGNRRIPARTNRRTQYFYDYYTGQRMRGKSKYELNNKAFELAAKSDDLGMLSQFCLQIERESMAYDYEQEDVPLAAKPVQPSPIEMDESVKTFKDFKVNEENGRPLPDGNIINEIEKRTRPLETEIERLSNRVKELEEMSQKGMF